MVIQKERAEKKQITFNKQKQEVIKDSLKTAGEQSDKVPMEDQIEEKHTSSNNVVVAETGCVKTNHQVVENCFEPANKSLVEEVGGEIIEELNIGEDKDFLLLGIEDTDFDETISVIDFSDLGLNAICQDNERLREGVIVANQAGRTPFAAKRKEIPIEDHPWYNVSDSPESREETNHF
jgi:hypothetical protein